MTYRVFIPLWRPALDNQLQQSHWRVKHRLKKMDAAMVSAYFRNVPKAACKRRVSLELIHGPRRRDCDPLAPFKSLLDALVQDGQLIDDSPSWCEVGLPLVQRRPAKGEEWGCWIELTDVDHETPKGTEP